MRDDVQGHPQDDGPDRLLDPLALSRSLRSTSMPTVPVLEPVHANGTSLDEQLLHLVFDRAPMGVAVFDTNLLLQRCNRTWTHFYEHYLGVGPEYTTPGASLHDLIPGNEESIQPLVDAVLSGQVIRQAAHRVAIPGLETFWDVVFAPLFEGDRIVGIVDIVTDATDRVRATRRLQARIATFTRVAAGMSVDQPLSTTLASIVDAVRETTDAYASSIVSWGSSGTSSAVGHADPLLGSGLADALAATYSQPDMPVREVGERRLILQEGMRGRVLANPRFAALHPYARDAPWDDVAIVPLTSSSCSYGELHVYLEPGQRLDDDDEAYLTALADQAAVAAQNAELFGAAAQAASLEARHRLARDLHDSVSQALFSMTLHASTAARHLAAAGLDRDHPAQTEVGQLQSLTRGALAEMRALIFELRPGALAEEGLVLALTRQAAALSAREQIPITVTAGAAPTGLDPDVEEHLYRVTLEALNNAVKHAGASRLDVEVTVGRDALDEPDGHDGVRITVVDDGRGFDAGASWPGHLGLRTMAERAEAVGAHLEIVSEPGAGTTVTLTCPTPGST
jgi:signal transduction histidine kinase